MHKKDMKGNGKEEKKILHTGPQFDISHLKKAQFSTIFYFCRYSYTCHVILLNSFRQKFVALLSSPLGFNL